MSNSNILAELGRLLIEAEIDRQKRTAAASQVSEAQDAATVNDQMTKVTRQRHHTTCAGEKKTGG